MLYTEGYTIRGVQKVLKDQGVKHVSEMGRNGEMVIESGEEETVVVITQESQNDNDSTQGQDSDAGSDEALSPAATVGETADLFSSRKALTSAQSAALRNVLSELKSLRDMLDEALDNADS